MNSNSQTGVRGEELAAKHIVSKKYTILERNYRTPLGEIDIIAQKDNKIAFIEVKCRIGDTKGKPYEAITRTKLHHMRRAATFYILQKKLKNYKLSLHVISIQLKSDLTVEKLLWFDDLV